MTKKQKLRRNSFAADLNAGKDDFILADLDVMRDEEELSPVPLNHFLDDEEIIDRLLINSRFGANDELEENDREPDTLVIDNIELADEFDVNFDEQNVMTTDTASFDPEKGELNSFKSERENIKKLIIDCENKVKKAAVISYASLSFGFVALLSTIVMGVMLSSMHTKISKLSDLVSILEEDMGSIAGKNPDLEINNNDLSIEQLNQKVNGYPERLEEQSRSTADLSKNKITTFATKPATVNKSNDKLLTNTPVLENKKSSEAVVKKLSAEKKATNIQTAAGWSVILTAFEDLDYAKSKAAKYVQKGIPVKVIAVEMNNKTWYRLKVGGFKNKVEAISNADKIKKSLNLNSATVVNN